MLKYFLICLSLLNSIMTFARDILVNPNELSIITSHSSSHKRTIFVNNPKHDRYGRRTHANSYHHTDIVGKLEFQILRNGKIIDTISNGNEYDFQHYEDLSSYYQRMLSRARLESLMVLLNHSNDNFNKIRISDVSIDDYQSGSFKDPSKVFDKNHPCGVSGSLERRIKDCNNQETLNSSKYTLVSRLDNFRKVYLDNLTGFLWTDIEWSDNHTWIKSLTNFDLAETLCANPPKELQFNNAIWKIPSLSNFLRFFSGKDANKIFDYFMGEFWTSTIHGVNNLETVYINKNFNYRTGYHGFSTGLKNYYDGKARVQCYAEIREKY